MANFIIYGTRLGDRKMPTLHVVGTYASGGFDLINLDHASSTAPLMTQHGSEDATGLTGSIGPDLITGTTDKENATELFTEDGNFELVGIQITKVASIKRNGQQTFQASGTSLSNYVEKTEHRYLQNGHLMMKVYFNEDNANLGNVEDAVFVSGCALLQAGSQAFLPDGPKKRKVPFALTFPFQAKGADVSPPQNPTINLNQFIYGSGNDDNFGTEVNVQDMGLPNTDATGSITWNTVRTQAWNFGQFQSGLLSNDVGSLPLDERFYPHFGDAMITGGSKIEIKNRRIDTARSYGDLYTEGSSQKSPNTEEGLQNFTYIGDVNLHTASGSSFDLRELHQFGSQTIETAGSFKDTWGRFRGSWINGPSESGSGNRYGRSGQFGTFPQLPSGETSKEQRMFVSHNEGVGFPHLGPGNLNPGGKSHFYSDGKCRNPYYPERHTAFSHYITFYKIVGHGTSVPEGAYLPDNITNLPLSDGGQYPFYVAESFRKSVRSIQGIQDADAQQIAAMVPDGTDWWQSPQSSSSPVRAVLKGAMSWQDYISNAFKCTANPANDTALQVIGSLTSEASDGSMLVDHYDILFSGCVPTHSKANMAYSAALNQGLSMTVEADLDEAFGVGIAGGTADAIGDSTKLYLYTVFMYSDHPQPRMIPSAQDPPGYELSQTSVFTGMNAFTHSSITGAYDVEHIQQMKNPDGDISVSNLIVNWASDTITFNCADRNSSDTNVNAFMQESDIALFANNNGCDIDSYTRCGCQSAVEEFALGELINFTSFEGDQNRFETIITYPRPVTTNQIDTISAPSSFPSILYINSYFAPIDTSTAIDSTFASDYLENSTPSNVTFDTAGGATHTHSFSDLGISDYGALPYLAEFNNNSTDTNTFTYLYMPGREQFEIEEENAYFVHDDSGEAQIFMTVQGAGSDQGGASNDIPHRQILLFQAPSVDVSGTSFKRAHSDLSFSQNWETQPVEASYLSLGTNSDCDTNGDDNPERRIRKFVNITGTSQDSGAEDDGDTGDGGQHDDGKLGCTDETAINFDPTATTDDGSCVFCDTVAGEGEAALLQNVDPFFYIPFAYYDTLVASLQGRLQGTLDRTTGASTGVSYGSAIEVPFPGGQAGSLTYDWWAGNAFNAFNTRGPNEAQTLGALNTPSTQPTDYTASPFNNTANSAFTYFRAKSSNTLSASSIAQYGTQWQFGEDLTGNTAFMEGVESLIEQIASENSSNLQIRIYRYSDWETHVATGDSATIPNEDQGNNGWYLDDYGNGTFPTGAQPNVYVDTEGDYSALNLNSVTPIVTKSNENNDASWNFKFDFRNYDSLSTIVPTDIGLEAGEQYVVVWRLFPKNSCSNDRKFYYWASNFFVKYCECTNPDSTNVGAGNPNNASPAPVVPYTQYPWNGESLFPGANNPNDETSSGLSLPGAIWPGNYCSITNSDAGLTNTRLCADRQPDASTDCDGFASWCLSNIRPLCQYTEDGEPFGTVSFEVLIDGFFTQSEIDTWSLEPFGPPYQNANNTVDFYWQITVSFNGSVNTVVPSHVYDGSTDTWSLNTNVLVSQLADPGDSSFYGQIASITFNDMEWNDSDVSAIGMQLQMNVQLEYLGMVDTAVGQGNGGTPIYNYPDYVVGADGVTTVEACPIYSIPYTADFEDCVELVSGCTDPLATNFNELASIDDGSCEFTDCTELYDSFRNSIFITNVTTSNDSLVCESVDVEGVTVNQYTPQYEGTMTITVQDFSLGVLGIGGTASNFVIGVVRMQGGTVNSLQPFLDAYDTNAATIQALEPGEAFTVPGAGNNACFVMPTNVTTSVTSVAGQVDPVGTQGLQTVTTVPEFAIFNTLVGGVQAGGLPAGQYLIFVIPHINLDLYQDDESGIGECTSLFLSFTDEMTFAGIDNTLIDVSCPEPCNQFTNPADCPDAIPGCTDPTAENYNENATFDDGSCEYCVDCDPCDLYPLDPECIECDKGEETDILSRGALGLGARIRECDGETDECCPDPNACNYSSNCEAGNFDTCEYDCTDGGEDCDETEGDCDPEPPCPDPANPICDGEPTGSCIDEGDCPCVDDLCNQDCIFEGNCEEDTDTDDDGPTDTFNTTTVICIPDVSIPIPDITIDGEAPTDIAHAAAICDTTKGDKMLMKIKTGVEYDDTDLLKLSLINYIFTSAAKQQLDCIFDCNNYETKAKSGGKARGFTTRLRGAVDCNARWEAGKKQFFAGSSTFKKNTTVKYMRIQNGKLVTSFFTAKRDWRPGMDLPNTTPNQELRTWEPCVNLKYQEGTNPENYWQTFWEFITRFCSSCEVITGDGETEETPIAIKQTRNFGTSFTDEFGNEITF
tara:strand:- start:3802 stop:10752 length:6951 start_codon:yes stop_codon:yes gene_type:complete